MLYRKGIASRSQRQSGRDGPVASSAQRGANASGEVPRNSPELGDGKENFGKEITTVCYPASSYPIECRNSLDYWFFCTLIFALVFARQNGMISIKHPIFLVSAKSILFAHPCKALYSQRSYNARFSIPFFALFLAVPLNYTTHKCSSSDAQDVTCLSRRYT